MLITSALCLLLALSAPGDQAQAPPPPAPLDCRLANPFIEAAIASKASSLQADEYCQYRLYENLSDLDGDAHDDLIVLFNLEPRDGNTHLGFMALFLSSRPPGAEPFVVATGGRGQRDAVGITVRDRRITLETREYLPGDPQCCPSGTGQLIFEFTGSAIKQVPKKRRGKGV